jgi:hypothetical protein
VCSFHLAIAQAIHRERFGLVLDLWEEPSKRKTAGKPYSVVMGCVQAMKTVDDLLPLHTVRDQGKAMLLFAPNFLLAYYPQCRQTPFS